MSYKIHARKFIPGRCVDLWIQEVNRTTGRSSFATEIVMKEQDGTMEPQRSLALEVSEAQFLMDQLWECGLRPSEGTGSAGQLGATQKHLEDMRTLVFSMRSVTAPGKTEAQF